jgi:hypothetical protein
MSSAPKKTPAKAGTKAGAHTKLKYSAIIVPFDAHGNSLAMKRTCGTCAAFYPDPDIPSALPECWNMTSVIELPGTPQAVTRRPIATDCCDSHLTHAEDEAQTSYIEEHRGEILDRITAQAEAQEQREQEQAAEKERKDTQRDQLQRAEVRAERITRQVIRKMRHGGAS